MRFNRENIPTSNDTSHICSSVQPASRIVCTSASLVRDEVSVSSFTNLSSARSFGVNLYLERLSVPMASTIPCSTPCLRNAEAWEPTQNLHRLSADTYAPTISCSRRLRKPSEK